jgi:hypothetical protein
MRSQGVLLSYSVGRRRRVGHMGAASSGDGTFTSWRVKERKEKTGGVGGRTPVAANTRVTARLPIQLSLITVGLKKKKSNNKEQQRTNRGMLVLYCNYSFTCKLRTQWRGRLWGSGWCTRLNGSPSTAVGAISSISVWLLSNIHEAVSAYDYTAARAPRFCLRHYTPSSLRFVFF